MQVLTKIKNPTIKYRSLLLSLFIALLSLFLAGIFPLKPNITESNATPTQTKSTESKPGQAKGKSQAKPKVTGFPKVVKYADMNGDSKPSTSTEGTDGKDTSKYPDADSGSSAEFVTISWNSSKPETSTSSSASDANSSAVREVRKSTGSKPDQGASSKSPSKSGVEVRPVDAVPVECIPVTLSNGSRCLVFPESKTTSAPSTSTKPGQPQTTKITSAFREPHVNTASSSTKSVVSLSPSGTGGEGQDASSKSLRLEKASSLTSASQPQRQSVAVSTLPSANRSAAQNRPSKPSVSIKDKTVVIGGVPMNGIPVTLPDGTKGVVLFTKSKKSTPGGISTTTSKSGTNQPQMSNVMTVPPKVNQPSTDGSTSTMKTPPVSAGEPAKLDTSKAVNHDVLQNALFVKKELSRIASDLVKRSKPTASLSSAAESLSSPASPLTGTTGTVGSPTVTASSASAPSLSVASVTAVTTNSPTTTASLSSSATSSFVTASTVSASSLSTATASSSSAQATLSTVVASLTTSTSSSSSTSNPSPSTASLSTMTGSLSTTTAPTPAAVDDDGIADDSEEPQPTTHVLIKTSESSSNKSEGVTDPQVATGAHTAPGASGTATDIAPGATDTSGTKESLIVATVSSTITANPNESNNAPVDHNPTLGASKSIPAAPSATTAPAGANKSNNITMSNPPSTTPVTPVVYTMPRIASVGSVLLPTASPPVAQSVLVVNSVAPVVPSLLTGLAPIPIAINSTMTPAAEPVTRTSDVSSPAVEPLGESEGINRTSNNLVTQSSEMQPSSEGTSKTPDSSMGQSSANQSNSLSKMKDTLCGSQEPEGDARKNKNDEDSSISSSAAKPSEELPAVQSQATVRKSPRKQSIVVKMDIESSSAIISGNNDNSSKGGEVSESRKRKSSPRKIVNPEEQAKKSKGVEIGSSEARMTRAKSKDAASPNRKTRSMKK